MPEDDRFLSLGIDVDRRLIQQSQRGLDDLRDSTISLTRTQTDSARSSRQEGVALEELDSLRKQILRSTELRIDALELEARKQLDLANAIDQTRRSQGGGFSSFEEFDKYNTQIRQRAGALGDIDTALSALGAGGVGQLFGAAEGAAQLAGAVKGLPTALAETASGLLGTSVSAGAVTAAAGVAIPVIGGLAIAIAGLVEVTEKGKALLEGALDAQQEYYLLLETATDAEVRSNITSLEQDYRALNATLADLEQKKPDTLFFRIAEALDKIPLIGEKIARLNPVFAEFDKQQEELENQAQQTAFSLDANKRALESGKLAAEDATTAQKEAARQQVDVTNAVKQASRSLAEATDAEDSRTAAIERSTQALNANAQIATNFASALQQARALQQQAAQEQKDIEEQLLQDLRGLSLDARRDLERDARRLAFDLDTLGLRAERDIFEQDLTRDFAGISRTRRDLSFDRAMAQRDAAFNREERMIQLRQAVDDRRIKADQQFATQITDVTAQLRTLSAQLSQQQLAARGLFVPGGYVDRLVDTRVGQALAGYLTEISMNRFIAERIYGAF